MLNLTQEQKSTLDRQVYASEMRDFVTALWLASTDNAKELHFKGKHYDIRVIRRGA